MHIDFQSSGGYANIELKYVENTDDLPKAIAEEIFNLVTNSGFFEISQSEIAPNSSRVRDALVYRLTINYSGRAKTLSFNDATAPTRLRPLLTRLQQLAINKKRKGG